MVYSPPLMVSGAFSTVSVPLTYVTLKFSTVPASILMTYSPTGEVGVASQEMTGAPMSSPPSTVYSNAGFSSP